MDITTFLPAMGGPVLTLLAFVVALSFIVAIHEYGHYIVGRWCGIQAEVFSLGFGPVLWSRMDKRGTRWQIAALPLGGYVKFLGDANAASMGSAEGQTSARNTMLGAPLWARAATVFAGPMFNFILSALMFALLLMSMGQAKSPLTVASVPEFPPEIRQELLPGDEVLRIGGMDLNFPEGLYAAISEIPANADVPYDIRRDGERIVVYAPYPVPAMVGSVSPRSAADDAGLRAGDVILSMNGTSVTAFGDMVEIVAQNGADPIDLRVWRAGETVDMTLSPRPTPITQEDGSLREEYKIGVASSGLFFEPQTTRFGGIDAVRTGITQVWLIIAQSLNGLWHMISGAISTCNLSSVVGIAETAGSMASQGTTSFLSFIAVLSTAVGLLNLFPIPMLDGGHLVFYAYEAITGRQPSERALRILMGIGLWLILSLMIFGLLNDTILCP